MSHDLLFITKLIKLAGEGIEVVLFIKAVSPASVPRAKSDMSVSLQRGAKSYMLWVHRLYYCSIYVVDTDAIVIFFNVSVRTFCQRISHAK